VWSSHKRIKGVHWGMKLLFLIMYVIREWFAGMWWAGLLYVLSFGWNISIDVINVLDDHAYFGSGCELHSSFDIHMTEISVHELHVHMFIMTGGVWGWQVGRLPQALRFRPKVVPMSLSSYILR
jgi:hypothetical protein